LLHRTDRLAGARLAAAVDEVAVGKISGAVGTYAFIHPDVEAHVCEQLGLGVDPISTQVVSRDRHAAFFDALGLLASSIERFAVEVRHLQRTEVGEAGEAFGKGQKGSSAMPHKRNPILSENLTGLARLIRGYGRTAQENVALWHERDISHSSVERLIGPDATVTADFMLHRFAGLVEGLVINEARMTENLERTGGIYGSQRVLLALIEGGTSREEAYRLVQRAAARVWDEGLTLRQAVEQDPELPGLLGEVDLAGLLDPETFVRERERVYRRVFDG